MTSWKNTQTSSSSSRNNPTTQHHKAVLMDRLVFSPDLRSTPPHLPFKHRCRCATDYRTISSVVQSSMFPVLEENEAPMRKTLREPEA